MMEIRPIHDGTKITGPRLPRSISSGVHQRALRKVTGLTCSSALVEIYEARRSPIDINESFDPIDVLNYAIEELGHTQAELAELLDLAVVRIGNSLKAARSTGPN